MNYAHSEDSDQPGHPPSLFKVFTVCLLIAKDPRFLDTDNKDSDQTGQMPRQSESLLGAHVILFVLLCCGSYIIDSNMFHFVCSS